MLRKILLTLAVLALLLMPAAASAQNLFPLALGMHYDFDGSDLASPPHQWQCRMQVVAQNITISTSVFPNIPPATPTPQTYFHLRQINPDPYIAGGNVAGDLLIRSNAAQAYFCMGNTSSPPLEWLQFQAGPAGPTPWFVPTPDGQSFEQAQITGNPPITVPYGGPYSTSENTFSSISPVATLGKSYLVSNLGLIEQINNHVDASRVQATLALRQIGTDPFLLFPLKSGTRLTYDASDNQNNTWQMTLQVLEQVTLGGQTYFHLRQSNYDPYDPNGGPNLSQDFYARSTASQILTYNGGDSEVLQYQAAGPNTTWNAGDKIKLITSITPVNVLGGGYLAYVTQQTEGSNPSMDEYVVPGLGVVKIVDNWTNPEDRSPLNFTLVKVSQGGPNQALLLLME